MGVGEGMGCMGLDLRWRGWNWKGMEVGGWGFGRDEVKGMGIGRGWAVGGWTSEGGDGGRGLV